MFAGGNRVHGAKVFAVVRDRALAFFAVAPGAFGSAPFLFFGRRGVGSIITYTTDEAQRVYEAAIAGMTPAARVAMCMEMIAVTDDPRRAGIRLQFPETRAEEFDFRVLRAKYGLELARHVKGRSE